MRSARGWARPLAVAAVAAIVTLLAAPIAQAVNWGPLSSRYRGSVVVSGTGSFYNDRGAFATNKMIVTDSKRDRNRVYGRTEFLFGDRTGYDFDTARTTGEFENTTVTRYLSRPLGRGNYYLARAESEVCAQLGWPVPDSCSSVAVTTFRY
jgi:hypothetical protein